MKGGERFHLPLVLCCAEENEVALVRAVDELHQEGWSPEVVSGVEVDAGVLSGVLDRTKGLALFVLCQSDELDANATRKLSGLFSARRGPDHRLLVVTLNPSRPLSILPGVREAMTALAQERYDSSDQELAVVEATPATLMRDVVGPMPVSALTGPSTGTRKNDKSSDARREALAREMHQEMLAAEALLTKAARTPRATKRSAPPGRSRAASGPVVSGRSARKASSSLKGAALGVPEFIEDPGAEPGAPVAEVDDDGVAVGGDAQPLAPALGGVPQAVPLGDAQVPDAVETELTPTDQRVVRRKASSEASPPAASGSAEPRSGSRVLLFAAIAGITALAFMAVLHMSGSPLETDQTGAGAVPSRGLGAQKPVDGGSDGGSMDTYEVPTTLDVPTVGIHGVGQGVEHAGAQPRPGNPSVEPTPSTPPERSSTPPPPSDRDALVIDQAIAQGKLRALDSLLLLYGGKETMSWDSANRRCRGRKISGLGGWRLPSRRELVRLRRARLLAPGTYWTRVRNETKDEAYALDTRSGRSHRYLTVEPIGRPVCVRTR